MARQAGTNKRGGNNNTNAVSSRSGTGSPGSQVSKAVPQRTSKAIRGKAVSKKKTEASWLPVLGLGLTLALNFGQMAYTGGVVMTRLSAVEETAKQSQLKYDSVNGSNVKMASLEANLTNVIEQLKRIEGRLDRVLSEAPSNVRK